MSTTYITVTLRREVIERAGDCCEYCLISQRDVFFALEVDHIIAEKHGGLTTSENLCLACPDCNNYKGSDIASVDWEDQERIVGLYHPRRHSWDNHFQYQPDGMIEPLSAEGRVTLFLLRLNDTKRVTDRRLLLDEQRYPCMKNSH